MARVGRPKEVNPREKMIGIRLTDEEHKKLLAYTEDHNQTITQTVVDGLNYLYEKKPLTQRNTDSLSFSEGSRDEEKFKERQ